MKKSIVVRDGFASDRLEIVWLWLPKWIHEKESEPVYPYNGCYLKPSYKSWWCWAVKRTGFMIGTIYEPVHTLNEHWDEKLR